MLGELGSSRLSTGQYNTSKAVDATDETSQPEGKQAQRGIYAMHARGTGRCGDAAVANA